LHAIIWAFGKQLIFGTTPSAPPILHLVPTTADAPSQGAIEAATVKQLATALRMNGIEGDDDTLLSSLEHMALAGEVSFEDFIGRVQNLFPRVLDQLDVSLRMKVAALVLPETSAR